MARTLTTGNGNGSKGGRNRRGEERRAGTGIVRKSEGQYYALFVYLH